jgi:O-antigen ligase
MLALVTSILILLSIIMYKLISEKKISELKNRFTGIVAASAVAVLFIVILPSPETVQKRVTNLADIENLEFGGDEPIQSRVELVKISRQLFIENPVFGIGFGGFKSYNELTELLKYPHNIFLELAVEGGVIGVLVLCAVLFLIVKSAFNIKKSGLQLTAYCLSLIAYSLTLAFFSKDISSQPYLWISLAFLGVNGGRNKINDQRTK